jgi:hypothetical protein
LFINLQNFGYKLLISGRPPLDARGLRGVSTIEIRATDQDVETYITKQLEGAEDIKPKVREKFIELVNGVDGM